MKVILLNIYRYFYGNNAHKQYKSNRKYVLWFISNITFRLCAILFTLYMKIKGPRKPKTQAKGEINEKVIISLTSFPKRIQTLWMVVDSLCNQRVRPKFISLTLCEDEFHQKEADLPKRLLFYKRYGLKINWVKNNLGPHTKYLFSMKHYPNKYIITVDDDIYYRSDLVEHLWTLSQQYPQCVCTNNALQILDGNYKVKPYNLWGGDVEKYHPSHNYLALGYNGVIYPPHVFFNEVAFDACMIMNTASQADDLWLKAQELLNDVKVVVGGFYATSIEIFGSQKVSLMSTNTSVVEHGNDIQWQKLDNAFGITQLLTTKVKDEDA